jgi:hypothetical protein
MTDTTEPSWVREGGTVAVDSGSTISFETIERLTKTVVILANRRRFRRGSGFHELDSDNGAGHRTNQRGHLLDPEDRHAVATFAQQQLRRVAHQAQATTYGAGATIHKLDPQAVRDELDRIADLINAARKEVDRRAHL